MIVPARVATKICPYIQFFATFNHIRVFSDDLPAISDETQKIGDCHATASDSRQFLIYYILPLNPFVYSAGLRTTDTPSNTALMSKYSCTFSRQNEKPLYAALIFELFAVSE